MDEQEFSSYENALATLRPESAGTLTDLILESLRSEELRCVRRKALAVGWAVGSLCGAAAVLLLAFVFFRPETKPFVENGGMVAVEIPNRETDPLLDNLDVLIRNRHRSEIRSETAVSSNRERTIARQLLKELSSGRQEGI